MVSLHISRALIQVTMDEDHMKLKHYPEAIVKYVCQVNYSHDGKKHETTLFQYVT